MYPEIPANHQTIVSYAYYGTFDLVCLWELVTDRRAWMAPATPTGNCVTG